MEGGGANCLEGGRGRGKLSQGGRAGVNCLKVEGGGANCLEGGRAGVNCLKVGQTVLKVEGQG